MAAHNELFNTEKAMDERIAKDTRVAALADLLHRTFANSTGDNVNLGALSHDDLGMSIELTTLVKAFKDSGIVILPANPQERVQTVAAVMQLH